MRITFALSVTCHAVNPSTARPDLLDCFIGFSTGDIVWLDPISARYSRLNKGGIVHPHPILHLLPHPQTSSLLLAVYQDGTIITYSLDREDPVSSYTIPWDTSLSPPPSSATEGMYTWRNHPGLKEGEKEKDKERGKLAGRNPVSVWRISPGGRSADESTWAEQSEAVDTGSTTSGASIGSGSYPGLAHSPASAFSGLSAQQTKKKSPKAVVTAAAISPDGRWLAVCEEGGWLKLVDIFGNRFVPFNGRIVPRKETYRPSPRTV